MTRLGFGRDRPGAVVVLGPERPAGMDEQHLAGGVGQAVKKDAGAALGHGQSCELGPWVPRSSLGMICGRGGSSAAPEGPVRGEEFVLDLGEGANDLDWLLAGAEDRPRREAQGRVLGVVAGLREELRLFEAIDQAADIRPIERTAVHMAQGSPVETSVQVHRKSAG
jgi:hypothetical protein